MTNLKALLITSIPVCVGFALGVWLLRAPPLKAADSVAGWRDIAARTDAATGCQYLVTRTGGITPRLGVDGRQVCTAEAAVMP